jgi:enoyl-CoA hydratase/carnithine racemase
MIEAEKTYEHILFEQDGPVAYVTMNRPKKRNALSLDHMQELISCFKAVGESKEAQIVILRGEGPAFCAGHDLSEMIGRDPAFYRHLFDVCCELMETVQSIPQPVIAQVHATATAAGCQLAATCDLVVAAEEARFATPGVRIGLFCSTPMVALSRAVGQKKSMEMLLTGDFVSAEEALAAGLANRVVPADELEAQKPARRRGRQAGVLPTVGDDYRAGLRVHEGGHVLQRDLRRRPGGHVRFPREAPS